MRRENWIVGDFGVRPAGRPDECLYCRKPVGESHALDCVIRQRTVVVDVKVRLVMKVVDSWDEEQLDFHYNDGRWCASNIIGELQDVDDKRGCLCECTEVSYVREATEEDEEEYQRFVSECKS